MKRWYWWLGLLGLGAAFTVVTGLAQRPRSVIETVETLKISNRTFWVGRLSVNPEANFPYAALSSSKPISDVLETDDVLQGTTMMIQERGYEVRAALTPPFKDQDAIETRELPVAWRLPGFYVLTDDLDTMPAFHFVPSEGPGDFIVRCGRNLEEFGGAICDVRTDYPADPFIELRFKTTLHLDGAGPQPDFFAMADRMRVVAACLDITDEPTTVMDGARLRRCMDAQS